MSPDVPIPDWMRCINCKVPARHGVIVHGRTCPEYGRISGTAKPSGPRRAVRYDQAALIDAASRYERFTAQLVQRRPERYDCPACGARGDGHGLRVTLAGTRILFHCFSGAHSGDEVLRALRMDWSWIVGEADA
jgi:hypothetical protein